MPRLNTTCPFSPPLPWNLSSKLSELITNLWGNTPKANGSAKADVRKTNPRRELSIARYGRLFSNSVFWKRRRSRGGMTITGVEVTTRLMAVSPTAIVAAFWLFPRLVAGTLSSMSTSSLAAGVNG